MLAFWFGIVPVLLTLLAVYGASWVTYRASKRLVSPVNWLARRVSRWDPGHPEAADLEPNKLPADMQGETQLAPHRIRWPTGSARMWRASAISPATPAMNCAHR